ncbi:MAG: Aspartyl/glutamyl-tRNA(Asn/Gln) amidotransferase subunit B [Parcubacteria group bacterium GW2011_GWA2_42_14]|nr:MAG: Aspartyl/glutamyl-tRNA(Asn/Gln) amidotransferase subunit B [Parcubacteria group bacterium GW2011_GWA2_42_14]OGZ97216.1 MAG: glutaminyl-tRNA synthase (glutamine-hydrolyzing) subunit B [Candidatus Sungbacteria bacterium RIFCSPHIGHO2_02_FULL_41_12b]
MTSEKLATYAPVIGLEIHAELNTKTKMFCDSLNDPDEKHPNLNICPVCMGHPGTLPVINQEAVKKVIQVGLALGGEIPEFSQFDRKNYFYPDLPKGYQISQYKYPLVQGGVLEIGGKKIRITRIHLEEDAGRLIHEGGPSTSPGRQASLVDFNRAGRPLMELVTEPDLRSGEDVRVFGEKLQQILRYVGASNADMEKGEMRVEVNISLRQIPNPKSQIPNKSEIQNSNDPNTFGTKVEIKNINSFKYAEDAVNYEIKRQTEILESGGKIVQETRGWNERKGESFSQRSKEESHDYRYFPEPDLPPLNISRELVEELKGSLRELPEAKKLRFIDEYGIDAKLAEIIVREKALADYFESVVSEVKEWEASTPETIKVQPSAGGQTLNLARLAANFITGDFLKLLHETSASVSETLITPENFGEFLTYLAEDKISSAGAKIVFEEMFRTGADPSEIIRDKNMLQVKDSSELEAIIKKIIEANPKPVDDYKKGAQNSLQFLMGQVMKETKGRANPKMVQDLIQKFIEVRLP